MIDHFVHESLPGRVLFGWGTLERLEQELATLGASRALVLTTAGQKSRGNAVAERLGERSAGVFSEAAMHTPVAVTERAMRRVERDAIDVTVAIGGGSTIGLGKALALRCGLPQIAVPTTYAGSEMTPILGQTDRGSKTTLRALEVLPAVVIYDVSLTLSLPPQASATSGLNAIAHAAEALYASERSPVIALMAEEGIRALAAALPVLIDHPRDPDARAEALYGAWLCGSCLGSVGMALHHKLCHVLGGAFDLPHAETHAVLLPHTIAYNAPVATAAAERIARALAVENAAQGLADLATRLGAPRGLKDIGMPIEGIEKAAERAMRDPYWNPRAIEHDAIRALIARAWAGDPPLH